MANPPRHAKAPAVLGNRRNRYYANWLSFGVGGSRPSIDEWLFGAATPWTGATLVGTTPSSITSFTNTHTYTLPTVAVGDRLVLIEGMLSPLASNTATTDMSAWTSFLASEVNAFQSWRGYTIYIADAAMVTAWSGVTVTFNSANGGKGSALVGRIASGDSGGLDAGFDVSALSSVTFSAAPNSPSLTAAWGAEDTLWLTAYVAGSTGNTLDAAPANYGNAVAANSASGVVIGWAWRQLNTATEDPGAFTIADVPPPGDGGENWQAITLAFRKFTSVTVNGNGRAPVAITARITGQKVGGGTTRAAVPVAARSTASKQANGATRGLVTVAARSAGSKIAAGTTRAAQGLLGRVTGSAVTAAQGTTRAVVTIVGRVTGSKVATGTTRATTTVTARPTASKIATGNVRATPNVMSRVSASKTATGAAIGAVTTIALAVGTAEAAINGTVRAAVTIVARITGTKVTTGSTRATVPTVARIVGSKSAQGTTRPIVPIAARALGQKTASGTARAVTAPTARATGSKTAQGAIRAPQGIVARGVGSKIARGFTRTVHAIVGLVVPNSGVPPLPVANDASAHLVHAAIAHTRHDADTTTRHSATANLTSSAQGVTFRHHAIARRPGPC